jgi:hypothetical protein
MNMTFTLGDALTSVVLIITVFNAWQHMSTKTKVLELKLWITDNFVSKKTCEEHRRASEEC